MAEPYGNHRDTDGQLGGAGRAGGDHKSEHLVVRSVPVPDPGDLLSRLPDPAPAAWIRHGAGLVGWGEAARVTLPAGADRFTAAGKWLRDLFEGADVGDSVQRRGSGLVAFGSFTFDDASEGSVLGVPRVILGRGGDGAAWLTTISAGREGAGDSVARGDSVPSAGKALASGGVVRRGEEQIRWHDGALTSPEWERAVAAAVRRIKNGDLRKVVLARDLFATADAPIDPRVLLRRLAARYPDCFTFACAGLVGATPELLIRRDGEQVSALVLAGTKPRGATAAEDARLAKELTTSLKENEEHSYAVASMRETLAPLCLTLAVDTTELVRYANLQHLGTWVRGRLAADQSVLGLVAALHPTAAVGGTPTSTAVELIRELENMDRERYAGPVGWMDADGNGEWGIALRCAQLDGDRARLFAGCGIVAGSDPAAEVAETQVKFRPMRSALEQEDLSGDVGFCLISRRRFRTPALPECYVPLALA
jgi:menaquinone-specific isochorismate synthase